MALLTQLFLGLLGLTLFWTAWRSPDPSRADRYWVMGSVYVAAGLVVGALAP